MGHVIAAAKTIPDLCKAFLFYATCKKAMANLSRELFFLKRPIGRSCVAQGMSTKWLPISALFPTNAFLSSHPTLWGIAGNNPQLVSQGSVVTGSSPKSFILLFHLYPALFSREIRAVYMVHCLLPIH